MRKHTREELIQRYENVIKRWNGNGSLIRLFPEKYEEIRDKLQALKGGAEYHIIDVTKECVAASGALMCGGQQIDRNGYNIIANAKRYQDGLNNFVNNFDNDGRSSDLYFKWGLGANKRAKDIIEGYILEKRKHTYLIQCDGYRTEINKKVYNELLEVAE